MRCEAMLSTAIHDVLVVVKGSSLLEDEYPKIKKRIDSKKSEVKDLIKKMEVLHLEMESLPEPEPVKKPEPVPEPVKKLEPIKKPIEERKDRIVPIKREEAEKLPEISNSRKKSRFFRPSRR